MAKLKAEECDDAVCHSREAMFRAVTARETSSKQKTSEHECPPDKEELGRATWTLMHTLAAYYPEEPTLLHRLAASGFFGAIALLYPCNYCRERFADELEHDPPSVGSREQLSQWVCRQHNSVNELLDKPTFPCSIAVLDRRWRIGHSSCFAASASAEESLGQNSLPTRDTSS